MTRSVIAVEAVNPKIIVLHSGIHNGSLKAKGIRPTIAEIEVDKIGRIRI
jgi:NOL1/NOP2/fmu family ribosome biogenesis protein